MRLSRPRPNVKRVAAIAAAMLGSSSCGDGGSTAVDPPPPLVCSDVAAGQTLDARAEREGNVVIVTIRTFSFAVGWQVTGVGEAVGATVAATALPRLTGDSLVVRAQLETPNTTRVDFLVESTLTDARGHSCDVRRTFHLAISSVGVQVASTTPGRLRLAALDDARWTLPSGPGL